MTTDLQTLAWPVARLAEALEALALRHGGATAAPELAPLLGDDAQVHQWLTTCAAQLGFELEAVHASYGEVEQMVNRAGPALLRLQQADKAGFLILYKGGRRTVTLLGPDLKLHRASVETLADTLRLPLAAPLHSEVEQLLTAAQVPIQRRSKAQRAILRERLSAKPLGGCWLLRLPPGASVLAQAHEAGLFHYLTTFCSAYLLQYGFWLISWWVLGRAALQGRIETSWLWAWALLLLTLLPLRLLATWAQGVFGIRAGARLKARLLYGALRLTPDEVRQQGMGQFLGRVVESDAVETLALNGGFLALVASLELLVVLGVLSAGASGRLLMLLLSGWSLVTAYLGWRFYQQRAVWTGLRLAMTHDLIEKMVGHRTRLAQERPDQHHAGEDQALTHYLTQSKNVDAAAARLIALPARGWLIVGLAGLASAFISGQNSGAAFAVGLGGVLLARQAFERLAQGFVQLAGAAIAGQQVSTLFQAARRIPASPPQLTLAVDQPKLNAPQPETPPVLLQGHQLAFRYQLRGEPVLRGCSLQIYQGDRVLLEGVSGGGKSTLVALLAGLRQPDAGLLLLGGLDWPTLGAVHWRQRVAAAPQFHENHVLTETFAFNLLMGRRWPPHPTDLQEAETLCQELGLGPLLERMPAGLMQMVGETGWQLSHGERSRLYLARALLQGAELIILDESFAALDPENLELALRCVLARARTLLVVAHP